MQAPEGQDISGLPSASELVARLRSAAHSAGITDEDPLKPVLTAFEQTIQFLEVRLAASDRRLGEYTERALSVVQLAKSTAQLEEARLQAAIRKIEAETMNRFITSFHESIEGMVGSQRFAIQRNAVITSVGLVLIISALAFTAGFWRGGVSVAESIHQTELGLTTAFKAGPEPARRWMELMEWNNRFIVGALDRCSGDFLIKTATGQKACKVELYIGPPASSLP